MAAKRMGRKSLAAALVALGVAPVCGGMGAVDLGGTAWAADWSGWNHSPTLAVQNNVTTALPTGYTVKLVLDTYTLFNQGLVKDDCSDLRVSYVGGGGDVELDRLVLYPKTDTTTVVFRTQAAIAASGLDTGYRLHYGNAAAGSPPANPASVYAFYDDFQDGDAAGWITKGTWAVASESGNYFYRYTGLGQNWALAYVSLAGLSDLDYVAKIRAATSTNWIGLAFRISNQTNFLTFYQSRDVSQFKLGRIVSDNHTIPVYVPFTMAANAWYRLRLEAIGTTVRARIWADGATEPGSWLISTTETSFQTASNVGATLYYHTTTADWDDITVRRLVATEPTVSVLADEYTLTVSTYGSGSVTKSPDRATYHYGDVVTLTALAADGWTFSGWTGGPTGNPATVTIQGNMAVTANFAMNVAAWWNSAWGYRARVTVTNASGTEALRVGYSVGLPVDAAALAQTGRALADCSDLRVVSFDGVANTELARVVVNPGTSQAEVWFALPRAIAPGAQDAGYYLYYGNASAGAPPANASHVFLFYEDWEQGTAHWTSAGGLDGGNSGTMGLSQIVGSDAVSPTHSQEFPTKASGGDAFSGYIPVTASTGYAIGAWAKSATGAYLPVGVDPYDAGHSKGTEIWLWTNEWTVGPQWSARSARFTTPAGAAYVKIKSEWWAEGPGTAPVFLDDLYLRYALASEPTLALGDEESTVPGPTIADITDPGSVDLGAPVTISATVATTAGTIDAVTLRLVSPEARDVAMSLVSGDALSGTWQAEFTPAQGGTYTYRILAHATVGRSTLSPAHTLQVSDTSLPQIALVSIVNPILVKNTQTLVVSATDNGQVAGVTVTVDGATHAMSQQGSQYSYSWRVPAVGTIAYTVRATDTSNNQATLAGSFVAQAREVDVCTWRGGKAGAASFSMDDGNSACRAELEAAGIRGTYFYNGNTTQGWFATYSAAGHEIASHSVGHPCDTPTCTPNCTPDALWQIPYTTDEVTAYRRDQLDDNVAAIEAGTHKPVLSMAWPCGCADARRMTAAQPYFLGVRGYYDYIAQLAWIEGVNEPTPVEFMNLNSSASYRQDHIDQAAAEGKWAIVTSHGSCAGIDYIASRQNVLWVAPVGEVLEYIKVRDAAQFTDYARAGRTITFDAAHNLGTMARQQVDGTALLPIAFDNPVTLKVHILDSDTVLGVKVDSVATSYLVQSMDGTRYVTFDAALDRTRHVTVTLSAPTPVVDQVTDDGPTEVGDAVGITAHATVAEGQVRDVTLHVVAPQVAQCAMAPAGGDTYVVSFTPARVGSYTCYVSAANDEGTASQSASHGFTVRDTRVPQWRSLAQAHDLIQAGQANTLGAEGLDPGGLQWASLATDETGTWQTFDWGGSDWWNHSWGKRRAIAIQETAGLARSGETIDVPVSAVDFPGLTNCAAELRVVDASRHEVPSQVYGEQGSGGGLTCHLLFQADVGANATATYYVYYGNPAATAPAYATDLSSATAGGQVTVRSAYFDLDLDVAGGVVSRVKLPAGTNANLPLSTSANAYWGWHQVCSSLDGNITGKSSLCAGGAAPASGLTLATLLDGPIVKEFEFTSQKGGATYRMTYRFYAGSPGYEYALTRDNTSATVLNNFWYLNGSFAALGAGAGGSPATVYNLYDSGADHVRMASLSAVDRASIDGTDNDGTQLGAADYRYPSAAGLSLCVATGSSAAAAADVVARRAAPPTATLGAVESAPQGQYGSPLDAGGSTAWTPTAFSWQNPAVPQGRTVHWRIQYCDVTGNCATTSEASFRVGSLDEIAAAVPADTCISAAHPCVAIPVRFTRADVTPVRAYSVMLHLSPELSVCAPGVVEGPYLSGVGESSFQVVDQGGGAYEVDGAILGPTCGATGSGTLFTLNLGSAATSGAGTITIDDVRVRDCVNGLVPGDPGAMASLAIDKTAPAAPAALTAAPGAVGSDGDGRIGITVTFTPPSDGSRVEVYRKAYGGYPAYSPGAVPDPPASYPPSGWTATAVAASGQADDPPARDHWYYVAYAIDGCGNVSPVSARTGGTLNYVLGDVTNGAAACAGNNLVNTADVSLLGAHYGAELGQAGYLDCLDVGPTTDYGLWSRPVPDGVLEFEDLVLFALNYTSEQAPGPGPAAQGARPPAAPAAASADGVELVVPALPAVGERFTATLRASGKGDLQALRVALDYDRTVVAMEGVESGELMARQGAPSLVLSPKPGQVDAALLGVGAGLSGEGALASMTFRVLAAGDAKLRAVSVDGRDSHNQKVKLTAKTAPVVPTVTKLDAARPNPFAQTVTLSLSLAQAGPADLVVYSVSGRRVRTLARGAREPGVYDFEWDGRDDAGSAVAAGIYYVHLITAGREFTRKVTFLR